MWFYARQKTHRFKPFVEKPSQPADRNERSRGRLQDPRGRPAILRKYANTCHQCAWCAHGLNGHGGTSAKAPSAKPRKRRTSGVPRCFSEEGTDWTTQGCGGIYAARTELLAHCVSASRLESLTVCHYGIFSLTKVNNIGCTGLVDPP